MRLQMMMICTDEVSSRNWLFAHLPLPHTDAIVCATERGGSKIQLLLWGVVAPKNRGENFSTDCCAAAGRTQKRSCGTQRTVIIRGKNWPVAFAVSPLPFDRIHTLMIGTNFVRGDDFKFPGRTRKAHRNTACRNTTAALRHRSGVYVYARRVRGLTRVIIDWSTFLAISQTSDDAN